MGNEKNEPKQSCLVVMPFGGIWDDYYAELYSPAGDEHERINPLRVCLTRSDRQEPHRERTDRKQPSHPDLSFVKADC